MPTSKPLDELSPGAARLVSLARDQQARLHHPTLGLHHWLLALLQRHGPMVEALADGLDIEALAASTAEHLQRGEVGAPLAPDDIVAHARDHASRRGRNVAAERDLATSILQAAGVLPATDGATPAPRAHRPTPLLDRVGEDITTQVRDRADAGFGREREVGLLIETLCRDSHRNAALVGPPGIGKRAVIEALAARVVAGDVPPLIAGARVIALEPATLLSGVTLPAELERRTKALIAEAGNGEVILVLEEIQALLGSMGPAGLELGNQIKGALARKQLTCILCADEEQVRTFVSDLASLERSFQLITVGEPGLDETLRIVLQRRDVIARRRAVSVPDEVARWIVEFANRSMRNRRFPEKALDLLDQVAATALAQRRSVATLGDAETIARRVTGLRIDVEPSLAALERAVLDRGLLRAAEASALRTRLGLTLRGADLNANRPNCVAMLLGDMAREARPLAECMAETLFGDAGRVHALDLAATLTALDNANSDAGPTVPVDWAAAQLERLMQSPWSVIVFEAIHTYPPGLIELIARALAEGSLALGTSRRLWLCDAVVLLAGDVPADGAGVRPVGFARAAQEERGADRELAEALFGHTLVEQCDFVWSAPARIGSGADWVSEWLRGPVTALYGRRGIALKFEPSAISWFSSRGPRQPSAREWERLLDEQLAPLLVPYLHANTEAAARPLTVRCESGRLDVQPA